MITSMTGYGAAGGTFDDLVVSVTVRGVNHKGLDLRVRAPEGWVWFDKAVREACRSRLHRGRVEVKVEARQDTLSGTVVNEPRFTKIVRELEHLVGHHGLSGGVSLSDVFAFEGVFETSDDEDLDESLRLGIVELAIDALDEFVAAREVEGRVLCDEVEELLDSIDVELDLISGLEGPEMEAFRGRLRGRLSEAISQFSVQEIDEERMAQELVIYADRSDVSEELQRASSHVAKLQDLVAEVSEEPKGKAIDFYLQELMREANTLGAKTPSTEVTNAVIRVKTAVEKLREQAANIE